MVSAVKRTQWGRKWGRSRKKQTNEKANKRRPNLRTLQSKHPARCQRLIQFCHYLIVFVITCLTPASQHVSGAFKPPRISMRWLAIKGCALRGAATGGLFLRESCFIQRLVTRSPSRRHRPAIKDMIMYVKDLSGRRRRGGCQVTSYLDDIKNSGFPHAMVGFSPRKDRWSVTFSGRVRLSAWPFQRRRLLPGRKACVGAAHQSVSASTCVSERSSGSAFDHPWVHWSLKYWVNYWLKKNTGPDCVVLRNATQLE